MIWIVDAKYLEAFKVKVTFSDGTEKIADLENKIKNEKRSIFLPLKDAVFFSKVRFNPEIDTIEWPNGADLAPEFLYDL
ncbi:MAG: DUF2442 domain-containing protein [Candidatus Wallbacteria bacterium]|nr:DUF2442 domain-containing protein [Candidatus Wallbacteria bacterium]